MAQPAITPIPKPETDLNAPKFASGKEPSPPPVQSDGTETSPSFSRAVDDAMCLLVHAAETGKEVEEATRSAILQAKAGGTDQWDEPGAANVLAALTKLATQLSPVTADSIRASSGNLTKPTIKSLRLWTAVLAVPIVVFSFVGFVTSSISAAIRNDINTANELLVKLRAELGTKTSPTGGTPEKPELPKGLNEGDVITQLQSYASNVRAIDARTRQLNAFVFNTARDPFAGLRWKRSTSKDQEQQRIEQEQNEKHQDTLKKKFQLEVGLPNMPESLDQLTTTYQDVRSFAQDVLDLVSVYYGAITTCLLPVLYALLGTCAYLLRTFEEELRTLTFMPSSRANLARFLIAGIGGAVVGLFGNFTITQGASISPLAVAFLVGYAVDVFFSFLEGLLQAFTKNKNAATPQLPARSSI